MKRKLALSIMLSGALGWGVTLASAQEAPPPPPPPEDVLFVGPGGDPTGGFFGSRVQLLGFEGIHGGKVVTGAPFSATAVTETTQTLADGNHITRTVQTNIFRDNQGRVRREVTLPAIGPLAAGQTRTFIFISDPVAGTSYILHPDTKTADQLPKPFAGGKGPLRAMAQGKMQGWQQQAAAQGNLNREDLGAQSIGGVNAQGTRVTHVIPAGQIGNEKPITVVSERWFSNDLQILVMSKRSDPRFGNTSYTLTNIQRSEPNASLFTVPAGYTVTQGAAWKRMMRRSNTPAPPPPPDN